jgi:histone-arginine methyltransferase CARM1
MLFFDVADAGFRTHTSHPSPLFIQALGRIHVSAFSDATLHAELMAKAAFWQQPDFYGVDLTCLEAPAADGYFQQVVVDAMDAGSLVSGPETRVIDFGSVTAADLARVVVPLRLVVAAECDVHGVAAWFDVLFDGSGGQRWLSTAPGLPTTHW